METDLIGRIHTGGTGSGSSPDVLHYLIGGPQDWHTGLQVYSHVEYQNVYPGRPTLVYHGDQDAVQYDLVLQSWADPSRDSAPFEGGNFHSMSWGDTALRSLQDESRHASPRSFFSCGRHPPIRWSHFQKGRDGRDWIGDPGIRPPASASITDGESSAPSDQDAHNGSRRR